MKGYRRQPFPVLELAVTIVQRAPGARDVKPIRCEQMDCTVDPQQVERFMRGTASLAENRTVVRHLLRGCPQCQAAARRNFHEMTAACGEPAGREEVATGWLGSLPTDSA